MPISPEECVLERLKSGSGDDRERWGEGQRKPKPKAEISTFRVRIPWKTAGRDHMSPFQGLMVLSEGGSMLSTAKPQG